MGFPILVRWHLYIESGPCCNRGWRPVYSHLSIPPITQVSCWPMTPEYQCSSSMPVVIHLYSSIPIWLNACCTPLLLNLITFAKNLLKWKQNKFLAATKQLYEWSCPSVRPSVCPSVTPFSLCSCHHIIMKFSGVITIHKSIVHAKGQGQGHRGQNPICPFPDCDSNCNSSMAKKWCIKL